MRAVLILVWALAMPAAAAPDPTGGAAEFRVAAQAFRANKFDTAARAFEQAYALDPRPETAFSIAQANRLQYYFDRIPWRLQRAVQMYEAYLAALPAGPRARDAIDRLGEITPLLDELRRRGELVPYTPPIKTQIVVGAEVESAEVTIDGTRRSLWEPTDVTEGSHTIEVKAPGYEVARRTVSVARGRFLPVDVPLVAKPARLVVETESGAEVRVDGQPVDGAGPVLVRPGEHFVTITRRGRVPWSRSLVLARDRTETVAAPLVPTAQRKVSRWVLGTSLALAAGTGGVALWSYAARRDAERLDEKRRALDASPEDLGRYNARVSDADGRARLALGLGIAAIGVGGLGLAMFLFDHDRTAVRNGVTLTPTISNQGPGLELGGSF